MIINWTQLLLLLLFEAVGSVKPSRCCCVNLDEWINERNAWKHVLIYTSVWQTTAELGMHQFQFRPIPILELELAGIGIGIGRNWLELELELVGIGWNWSELVLQKFKSDFNFYVEIYEICITLTTNFNKLRPIPANSDQFRPIPRIGIDHNCN